MAELLMAGPACKLVAKQKITPIDVIELRQTVFSHGVKTPEDVATLLAIETACDDKCPQWDEFFISSISNYTLFGSSPLGAVSEEQVEWLKRVVTRDGLTTTRNEFEVLVMVLEKAKKAPSSLCALALDQVCREIYATGANRRGSDDVRDTYRVIHISLKRLTVSISNFSIHEHLRAVGLAQLIDCQDRVDQGQEDEILQLYQHG
jgi:hypothetical protein